MSSHLFSFQKQNRLIPTLTSQDDVILTSYDHKKLSQVLKIIKSHHEKSNKLLFNPSFSTNSTIYLTEKDIREPFNDLELTYFDLKDQNHIKYIANLYYIHKLKFFIINDFMFNEKIPLLTLQGITIQHGPQVLTDLKVYLDNIDTLYYISN